MPTKQGTRKRVVIVTLLVISLALVTASCDPGVGFEIVNERDEALVVQVGRGSSSFTIGVGKTDSIGVLLDSSMGTLIITGRDTGEFLFDQFLTWEQMTEMEFRLIID